MANIKDPDRATVDYAKILAYKLRQAPAWRDLAKACNTVLGKEVDDRRRKLEKIRDSVKYRRGDTVLNVVYDPDKSKKAVYRDTREIADIPEGYVIQKAKVRNVVKNIAYNNHPDTTDFLEIDFLYKDRSVAWLQPIQIPQERDILLKNAYIAGFDFFNTKFTDEDLQRLYEFIQIYWPESGTDDNYMKFIGFIKNARFDLVNLWSYDDGTDTFPELVPKTTNIKPSYEGGTHYLTSHVEIRYDISQFGEFYTIDLEDLETLFYYFAPIMVVLERIVGSLNVDTDVAILSVNDLTIDNYAVVENDTSSTSTLYRSEASIVNIDNYSITVEPTHFKNRKTVMVPADVVIRNYDRFSNIDSLLEEFKVSHSFKTATGTVTFNTTALDTINSGSIYSERNIIYLKSCLVNFACIQNFSVLNSQL